MSKLPNPHDQGALVSAAKKATKDNAAAVADRRLNDRNKKGRFVATVSDEQWEYALERIANGDTTVNVMTQLGVCRSTIFDKCDRDSAFKARYDRALEQGYFALAEDIRNVTRGVEGYSTGDVQRDALVAKYDLALAKSLANRIFGDKVQVNKSVIVYNYSQTDDDWE